MLNNSRYAFYGMLTVDGGSFLYVMQRNSDVLLLIMMTFF